MHCEVTILQHCLQIALNINTPTVNNRSRIIQYTMLKVSRQIFASHIRRGQALPSSAVLGRKYQYQQSRVCSSDTDDMSYNLTKHEAVTFLENVLGIPDPVSFVNTNKVAFLQEVMRQTKLKIPFTNIMIFKDGKFKSPSLNEFKQAVFTQEGGHCVALNTFTNAVLQCLGFDTYLISANVHRWNVPLCDNHTAVVVKHLTTPDSLHLVDVGSQYFLPLISLDFDRISNVYHSRSLQYRFFQVSPGVIQLSRMCDPPKPGKGDGLIYIENDACWEVLTTFQTSIPRKLSKCYQQTDAIMENTKLAGQVANDIWLISYPKNLFVHITSNRCLIGTETGKTEVTQMKHSRQVIDTILKYFPQYSRNHIDNVVGYFAKNKKPIKK